MRQVCAYQGVDQCVRQVCVYQGVDRWCVCVAVELERRIDFELPEGLVESRYWSAVTSHTGYWISHDVALFLLTFIYKPKDTPAAAATAKDDLEQD